MRFFCVVMDCLLCRHCKEGGRDVNAEKTINVMVYYPKSKEDKHNLAKRVAGVHAGAVIGRLDRLDCPNACKLQLLDAIIAADICGK